MDISKKEQEKVIRSFKEQPQEFYKSSSKYNPIFIKKYDDLISDLEALRIDVNANSFGDPTSALRDKYERANEMLDDCIRIVDNFFTTS